MTALQRGAFIGALLVAAACSGGQEGPPTRPTTTVPATSVADLPPITPLADTEAKRIKISGFVDWVVVAGGDAWVSNQPPMMHRLDGKTGDPQGTTRLPDAVCSSMDVGFGSVWAGACDSAVLVRIDEKDGVVSARIAVGERVLQGEGSVGAGEGAVWVLTLSPKPTLYKVDPETDEVADTFAAPEESAGVRAGLGKVWVTDTVNDELVAIDPRSGKETGRVKVGLAARFLTVGEDAVWVLNQGDATVTKVDPEPLKVVRKIAVGEGQIEGGDLSAGGGFIWARVSDSLIAQIDPESGEVVARYGTPGGSGSVAADEDAVWITVHDADAVWRVAYR